MLILTLAEIAHVCHEANRALCEANGDTSQVAWADAPGWQKDSAINGVRAISDGRTTRPEQSHESWLAEKEANGWVYGDVKDVTTKTHPCMVPYSQLPPEQRVKDHVYFAVATTLLGFGTP